MGVFKRSWRDGLGRRQSAWVVRFVFHHPDGRITDIRKHAEVNDRESAQEEERQIRAALLAGTYGTRKEPPTFLEVAEEWWTRRVPYIKHSTEAFYRGKLDHQILPVLGKLRIDRVTKATVADFTAHVARKLSPGGVNAVLRTLRPVLRHAVEEGYLTKAPRVEMVEEPDPEESELFLTVEQTEAFLTAAEKHEPEWLPFFLLAFRSGLRIGELIALQVGDVDVEHEQLHVRRASYDNETTTPKSGKKRTVPLPTGVVEVLHARLEGRGRKDLLFCYPDGSAYGRYVARAPTERICARAGLEPFNIHRTRHSYASHLVQRGVPLAVVASLLGQTVLQVTARYAHLAPSTLREAVQVLNPQTHFRHMAGPVRLVSGVTQRKLGRPTGVEPVTPGATVRCSAS